MGRLQQAECDREYSDINGGGSTKVDTLNSLLPWYYGIFYNPGAVRYPMSVRSQMHTAVLHHARPPGGMQCNRPGPSARRRRSDFSNDRSRRSELLVLFITLLRGKRVYIFCDVGILFQFRRECIPTDKVNGDSTLLFGNVQAMIVRPSRP